MPPYAGAIKQMFHYNSLAVHGIAPIARSDKITSSSLFDLKHTLVELQVVIRAQNEHITHLVRTLVRLPNRLDVCRLRTV
jgi:hypothetical protein